ncbi:MAG: hypothetical protein P8Y66_07325 [Nitrospirota bacterium]|jgi:uncharacterized protein involved in outer membrane biogenesis
MKTGSKVLIALAIVVIAVIAVFFFALANIDAIAKAAIEKYGSAATGTDVKVSKVEIKLKAGAGSISGLSVGNPSGFSAPAAFSMDNITVAIDIGSITKDPIVINRILVSAPRITYEVNESGRANINEIKKNLQAYQKQGPKEKGKTEGEKNLLIRKLLIEGGKVAIHVAALEGEPRSAKVPRIELTNVGGKGGASPGEIALQVLRPLVNRTTEAAARAGVEQYVGKQAEEVKKMLEEKAQEKVGVPTEEGVKKLFGK